MQKKTPQPYIIVLNSCPDSEVAENIAHSLVENRLAACVNIVPAIQSIYHWQGRLQQDSESLLIIKTRQNKFQELQDMICQQHPYELPEIMAVPIQTGFTGYLTWIDQSLDITQ